MKILHILYQSLPQVSGSSIRSRDILLSQKEIGLDVITVTSPFQNSIANDKIDVINGIKYIRTSKSSLNSISDTDKNIFKRILRLFVIIPFTYKLYYIIKNEKPDIIHAHAMFFCGIPSIIIGKIRKIPVVYEFRSLWMQTENKKSKLNQAVKNLLLKIEIFTMNKADFIISLNKNLKTILIKKGVKKNNHIFINNAINTTLIAKLKKKTKVKTRKELIFGYIGTITHYEGLPFLIEVFQELSDLGIKNKLLIYGNGIYLDNILNQINKRKDINSIIYKGSIAPSKINEAFNEIDIIINPRLKSELTDSVTPLKPLEAMAYEKLVIGSDVGGIKELIKNNVNGFLFKAEDKKDLIKRIKEIINLNKKEKERILNSSLEYVVKSKSWINNAKQYKNIYLKFFN